MKALWVDFEKKFDHHWAERFADILNYAMPDVRDLDPNIEDVSTSSGGEDELSEESDNLSLQASLSGDPLSDGREQALSQGSDRASEVLDAQSPVPESAWRVHPLSPLGDLGSQPDDEESVAPASPIFPPLSPVSTHVSVRSVRSSTSSRATVTSNLEKRFFETDFQLTSEPHSSPARSGCLCL